MDTGPPPRAVFDKVPSACSPQPPTSIPGTPQQGTGRSWHSHVTRAASPRCSNRQPGVPPSPPPPSAPPAEYSLHVWAVGDGLWEPSRGDSWAGPRQLPGAARPPVWTLDPAPTRPGWHGRTQHPGQRARRNFPPAQFSLALRSGAGPGEGQPLGDRGTAPRFSRAPSPRNSQLLLCSTMASGAPFPFKGVRERKEGHLGDQSARATCLNPCPAHMGTLRHQESRGQDAGHRGRRKPSWDTKFTVQCPPTCCPLFSHMVCGAGQSCTPPHRGRSRSGHPTTSGLLHPRAWGWLSSARPRAEGGARAA